MEKKKKKDETEMKKNEKANLDIKKMRRKRHEKEKTAAVEGRIQTSDLDPPFPFLPKAI